MNAVGQLWHKWQARAETKFTKPGASISACFTSCICLLLTSNENMLMSSTRVLRGAFGIFNEANKWVPNGSTRVVSPLRSVRAEIWTFLLSNSAKISTAAVNWLIDAMFIEISSTVHFGSITVFRGQGIHAKLAWPLSKIAQRRTQFSQHFTDRHSSLICNPLKSQHPATTYLPCLHKSWKMFLSGWSIKPNLGKM